MDSFFMIPVVLQVVSEVHGVFFFRAGFSDEGLF